MTKMTRGKHRTHSCSSLTKCLYCFCNRAFFKSVN